MATKQTETNTKTSTEEVHARLKRMIDDATFLVNEGIPTMSKLGDPDSFEKLGNVIRYLMTIMQSGGYVELANGKKFKSGLSSGVRSTYDDCVKVHKMTGTFPQDFVPLRAERTGETAGRKSKTETISFDSLIG